MLSMFLPSLCLSHNKRHPTQPNSSSLGRLGKNGAGLALLLRKQSQLNLAHCESSAVFSH